ncbi:hypothetical protein [Chamaesiphon sp. OTE_8_metabat_110]|nr:hypothetical protein [Chamaesiphon sp. OTE_8_metabat_110]
MTIFSSHGSPHPQSQLVGVASPLENRQPQPQSISADCYRQSRHEAGKK